MTSRESGRVRGSLLNSSPLVLLSGRDTLIAPSLASRRPAGGLGEFASAEYRAGDFRSNRWSNIVPGYRFARSIGDQGRCRSFIELVSDRWQSFFTWYLV